MANNNLDPVHLAKRVSNQLVSFSRGKSLQSKIDFFKWMYENENFGECCKMIIDGAEVVLKAGVNICPKKYETVYTQICLS